MRKSALVLLILLFSFSIFAADRTYTLTWDPNSESDLSHYVVYWGTSSGVYLQNSGNIGKVTTYKLTLPEERVYYIAVTAVDDSGLESDYSNEVNTNRLKAPTIRFMINIEVSTN